MAKRPRKPREIKRSTDAEVERVFSWPVVARRADRRQPSLFDYRRDEGAERSGSRQARGAAAGRKVPEIGSGSVWRFTRLTNGFSKKLENHAYSVALFVMFYNFVRIHL